MKHLAALFAVATLAACAAPGGGGGGASVPPKTGGVGPLGPGSLFHAPAMANAQVVNRSDRLPLARDHVVVFVGPNCRFCDAAVADTRAYANVRVEVVDAGTPYGAQQLAALRTGGTLPTVVANSQVLVGYDRRLLQQLLGGAGMRETNPTQN